MEVKGAAVTVAVKEEMVGGAVAEEMVSALGSWMCGRHLRTAVESSACGEMGRGALRGRLRVYSRRELGSHSASSGSAVAL